MRGKDLKDLQVLGVESQGIDLLATTAGGQNFNIPHFALIVLPPVVTETEKGREVA